MLDKNTLKSWFKTRSKPTQSQFWQWIDACFFKGEKLPMDDVDGLSNTMNNIQLGLNTLSQNKADLVDGKVPLEQLPTLTVDIKGEYANNTAALAASLEAGDVYSLPMVDDKAVLAVVKIPYYNFDVTANWDLARDENYDLFPITNASTFTQWLKNGMDGDGSYQNDGVAVSVSDFNLVGGRLRCILVADNTNLNMALLEVSEVKGLGQLNNLQTLSLGANQLTTFDPVIALPSGLQTLDLNSNQLTTFDPAIALPSGLQTLSLGGNQLTTFDPAIALPSGLVMFGLSYNNLPSSDVNSILEYWDDIVKSAPFSMSLQQIPSTPPSGAGITAKANLISRGCSIYTD